MIDRFLLSTVNTSLPLRAKSYASLVHSGHILDLYSSYHQFIQLIFTPMEFLTSFESDIRSNSYHKKAANGTGLPRSKYEHWRILALLRNTLI